MPIEGVNAFPLCWPDGWPRAKSRGTSNYEATEFGKNRDLVLRALRMWSTRGDIVLSTNVPLTRDGLPYASTPQRLQDPGVAVYWMRNKKPQVMASDRWSGVGENMRAIWYALDALRQLERCGASQILDRAYAGFAALPAAHRSKPWREVLGLAGMVDGLGPNAAKAVVDTAWRELAKIHHPDKAGGNAERMAEINRARDEALREFVDG